MRTLRTIVPRIEVYSIDEAFLDLRGMLVPDMEAFARMIQARLLKEVGLPVGIGIGPNKTLAKLANWSAKKWKQTGGVVDLRDHDRQRRLMSLPEATVGEVWGIGRRLSERLGLMGIKHAVQLADYDLKTLRRMTNVNVERTARELNGELCFDLDDGPEPKLMIACTRSFGQRIYELPALEEAVAAYITRAAEKLRGQRQFCQHLQVFIRTSTFGKGTERYSRSAGVPLPYPTADTRDLTMAALAGLRTIFIPGPAYAKAGIILMNFVGAGQHTGDLFAPAPRPNSDRLMAVMDSINSRQGRGTVRLARTVTDSGWALKREHLSPRYTTSWADLRIVY